MTANQKLDEALRALAASEIEPGPKWSAEACATLAAAHMQASTLDFGIAVLAQQIRAGLENGYSGGPDFNEVFRELFLRKPAKRFAEFG
ncbi:hypothetical protein [Bradyrhizobium jicamae]|nr:hypothetical protein [Bradyrhizobium jicamae]